MIVKLGQTTPENDQCSIESLTKGAVLSRSRRGSRPRWRQAASLSSLSRHWERTRSAIRSPNRAIVAWPFTDLSDERFYLGRSLISLRQTDRPPAQNRACATLARRAG